MATINNKPATVIDCPRCDGTGIYRGFGTCYRCHGRRKVNAIPATKRVHVDTESPADKARRVYAISPGDFMATTGNPHHPYFDPQAVDFVGEVPSTKLCRCAGCRP